ncbi:hypothetical protein M8494_12250 [Serratia ureilytica]
MNYAAEVEAAVATYAYYGYDSGVWRGPSMVSLAQVLTGKIKPQGKLPVNTCMTTMRKPIRARWRSLAGLG